MRGHIRKDPNIYLLFDFLVVIVVANKTNRNLFNAQPNRVDRSSRLQERVRFRTECESEQSTELFVILPPPPPLTNSQQANFSQGRPSWVRGNFRWRQLARFFVTAITEVPN
ncbi:hypothetical protein J6590_096615 [Homalodisca vitripennis]|nr:hypothetical protein J6590_096615 [Homalodisca vitripennis]